jgi:hypothetical protein
MFITYKAARSCWAKSSAPLMRRIVNLKLRPLAALVGISNDGLEALLLRDKSIVKADMISFL